MDNILIINQYASNPSTGYGGRSFYLAKALAKSKKVCLVCGSFNHNLRNAEHQISYIDTSNSNPFQFKSLKLFKYSSSKSFLRIINWFIFLIKICFLTKKSIGFRPSVIIFSSPALVGYMGAYFLAKRFSCDIYFEVRDIWPLSVIELGGVSKNHPLIIFLRQIEKFAYKTATGVISNLKDIQKHIEKYSIKVKRFHYLPNGVEENFNPIKKTKISDTSKIILKDLNEFNDSGKTIIGYVGGLALANAVDLLVETAFHAKKDKNLIFVVVGNGQLKQDLINKCMKLELDNIKFYNPVL